MGANNKLSAAQKKFSIKDFFIFCTVKHVFRKPDPYMKQQCLQW